MKSMRLMSAASNLAISSTCENDRGATNVQAAEEQVQFWSRTNPEEAALDSQTSISQIPSISFSQQEMTSNIETAVCPICSIDLTMKTRLQRLAHANICLENEGNSSNDLSAIVETNQISTLKEAENVGTNLCVICGKDIRKYSHQAREQHTNRCLDEVVLEQQVIQASKKTAEKYRIDNTYGNSPIPSTYAVTSCPCCHVNWAGNSMSLRRKMLHMKSCSRSNNISIQELGRRLQWSNWGLHTRPASKNDVSVPETTKEEEELKKTEPTQPEDSGSSESYHETFVLCTSEDESLEIVTPKLRKESSVYRKKIKPSGKIKSSGKENDEDMQLAIALSMSMVKEAKKKKSRSAGKATAASKNESCVLSLEDSKIVVFRNLENLLCTPKIIPKELDAISTALPPSKLAKIYERSTCQRGNKNPQLLWAIASSVNTKCDCFTTDFLAQFMVGGIVKPVI
ncbi:hypothetical protein INT43_000600 [Umbelopsis isabellina]|uniref:UBZ4-type domain-containing protein n=1 Tax=Mortierella isabellina TaxID=91625 RepID=A0A8H7UK42_MORIS|nr:hypothetical protein INT43_000600 [Umbelopsis isabellina]